MRYTSVTSTLVSPRSERRRLGPFVCARWRRPALERRTFPRAVILNRLATDFFVLMPLGRRINQILLFKKSAQYKCRQGPVQEIISRNCTHHIESLSPIFENALTLNLLEKPP